MKIGNILNVLFLMGVILMATISVVILVKTYEKKVVNETNLIVEATIIESPKSCKNIGRRPPVSKIQYKGKIFIKKTGNKFCSQVVNKNKINMLSNEKGDILLFPNEYDSMQFVYGVILFGVSILITIKKFRPGLLRFKRS